jgi:hypothetical protein
VILDVPTSAARRLHVHTTREILAAKGGTVGEYVGRQFCLNVDLHITFRDLLHAAKCDQRLYFPTEGRRAEDFFALKNPNGFAGLNPRTWVLKGSTLPLDHQSCYYICLINSFCASNVIIRCTVIHTKTQITTLSPAMSMFFHMRSVISAECGLMIHSDRISYLLSLILMDRRDSIPHPVFKLLWGLVNLRTWDRGNKKLILGAWIVVKIFPVSILKTPRWYLHLVVVEGLVSSSNPESYAGGSIATSRVSHARQVKRLGTRRREIPRRRELRYKFLWCRKQRHQ